MVLTLLLPRTAWVQKIKAASEQYIDTEKKKREKAYQGTYQSILSPAVRLGDQIH